jgi:hypothetical protein
MAALFIGAFGVTFMALNHHDVAALLSHHTVKPATRAAQPSALAAKPQSTATNGQPALAQSQARATPPSVFQ